MQDIVPGDVAYFCLTVEKYRMQQILHSDVTSDEYQNANFAQASN